MSNTTKRRAFDLPKFLDRENTAAYCALSESTMEKGVRENAFPKPRVLAGRRVGWLVSELDEWCGSRPVSELLPPANTSRKARPKPSSQTESLVK